MTASITVVSLLLVSSIALGGCASSEPAGSASATTEGDKRRDTIECMNQARETRPGPQGPRTSVDPDRYQQCMKARGHMTGP
jgi:hypothetical protein